MRADIQELLKLADRENFRKNYLKPALQKGLVEMVNPDSPKSPTQKYRLTDKGLEVKNILGREE